VDVQLAEPAAEGLVLVGIDVLVAEQHHRMLQEGPVDLVELLVAELPGQVDAGDLGADEGEMGVTVMAS